MPYIENKARERFDKNIEDLYTQLTTWPDGNPKNLTVGELNYVISSLVWKIFNHLDAPSYTLGNNLVGVLECVKQELYRRQLGPYEDLKIKENGDII